MDNAYSGLHNWKPGHLDDFGACNDFNCGVVTVGNPIPTSLVKSDTDISIVDASLGAKVRLFRHLLVTGNVLLKLNDSGRAPKSCPWPAYPIPSDGAARLDFLLAPRYCGAGELLTSSVSIVMDMSSPTMAGAPFTPKSLRLIVVLADAPT